MHFNKRKKRTRNEKKRTFVSLPNVHNPVLTVFLLYGQIPIAKAFARARSLSLSLLNHLLLLKGNNLTMSMSHKHAVFASSLDYSYSLPDSCDACRRIGSFGGGKADFVRPFLIASTLSTMTASIPSCTCVCYLRVLLARLSLRGTDTS
jgi:hypothetical protein